MATIRSDELNYVYVDKIVEHYVTIFVERWNKLKKKKHDDIAAFIRYMDEFYEDLYLLCLAAYLDIAKHYYNADKQKITQRWVKNNVLKMYDPVTLYVFDNEFERKKGRHIESVLSSETPEKEHDKSLKYFTGMFSQFADETADKAHLETLKDEGETKVVWVSVTDDRRCKTCKERHGKIYPISKVPSKPHVGCRCHVEKVNGQRTDKDT